MGIENSVKSKKRNTHIYFILYNLIVVGGLLTLSETILAYLLNHPHKIPQSLIQPMRAYYSQHLRSAIQMEPDCAIYDPELFYTLRPGTCTFSNVEFSTKIEINSKGLRDDEGSLENPEIILLGDSFTMGWGIDQDSTFEKHLENKTKSKILNAGISSYGTIRELALLKRIESGNLKKIIIQYHDSDLIENIEFRENGDSLLISPEEFYNENVERVQQRSQYFFGKHTALVFKFILQKMAGRLGDRRKTGAEDAINFLHALNTLQLAEDIQIIVFELSSYGESGNLFTEHLIELLKQNENKNLIPVQIQPNLNSEDYFILDDHINANGHKKVADALAKALETL